MQGALEAVPLGVWGLHYVDDDQPGCTRRANGDGFLYVDVWICADSKGHKSMHIKPAVCWLMPRGHTRLNKRPSALWLVCVRSKPDCPPF